MNREEYLIMRNNRQIGDIMYEFYKIGFDAVKHTPFLTREEFFESFSMWPQASVFIPSVHSYFDSKFQVLKVSVGNEMKYI